MASVGNLAIKLQTGTDNTYFASWTFETTTGSTNVSSSIKVGDLVTIKSGATYYNGVSIPAWVMAEKWYVTQVKGDRAVLGKNATGTYNIVSPINVKYLSGGSSSSSSSSGVAADTLDHFEVKWYYDTGNGVWFSGGESTTKEKNATYSPPENALKFKVSVKPVSKKHTENNKEKSHWTGTASTKEFVIATTLPPADPSAPSVEIEKFVLTAKLENITDSRTDKIQFEVYNGNNKVNSGTVTVLTQRAIFTCNVSAGGKYRVRCRAIYIHSTGDVYSEKWSNFSSEITTIPTSVTNPTVKADSKTSVVVSWTATDTATSYAVEYTTKRVYFDSSSEVSSTTVENTTAYISGLESGNEWFFRVRAINDKGESAWSNIVSIVIGTAPEAPTTWSLTTTAIVGDDIALYWTHNSEDGSKQTEAEIQMSINGSVKSVIVPGKELAEDEEEPTYFYTFSSKTYGEGATILWRVRTKGITGEYGKWSTQRTIDLFAPPTLAMLLSTTDGVLSSLPLTINLSAGPATQNPISYHIAITADNTYESNDVTGSEILVNAGTEVYSKIFIVSNREFELPLSAGDLRLENGQTYTVTAVVSMNSGLTAKQTMPFRVEWAEHSYWADASIAIDTDTLSAYISPFSINVDGSLVENVTMSIYRRESNGTFTELATGLANNRVTTITDPHPPLDYARYRIVAIDTNTGSVSYEDLPGYPIGESALVIQWAEKWTNFDYSNEDETEDPPWVGSMIKLPYNMKVSESRKPDVSLVEYIGRSNPVSYYGTQQGESESWSTEIPKTDKETVYALRRLASWMGDVYVREPSGTGYWANVTVSMSTDYDRLTIPVTIDVTRVEGGI